MFNLKTFLYLLIIILIIYLVGFLPLLLPNAAAGGMSLELFLTISFFFLFVTVLPVIEYYVIFVAKKIYNAVKTFIGELDGRS